MFDEVLKNERPKRLARRASYVVASTAVQAVAVGALAWLVSSLAAAPSPRRAPPAVDVKFVKGAPQPARPPPAPPPRKVSAPQRPAPPREIAPMVQPKAVPEQMPEPGPPEPPLEPPGPGLGVVGGAVGGGEEVTAPPARVDFDAASMTRPVFLSGPDLAYTRAALEREVEGLMVVACVVTREGSVRDCHVEKGLPFMDAAVVQALERRRYRPATLKGVPVEVTYQFRINWKLPR